MFKGLAQPTPFKEHPIVDITVCEPNEYDITAYKETIPHNFITSGKFSIKDYCNALLNKLCTLPKSGIKPFLHYQYNQLQDPFTWLNKLEKLIDINRELFVTNDQRIRIEKAMIVIEFLRDHTEKINNTGNRAFDFDTLKSKALQYTTYEDKLSMFMEAKTEYLQNKPVVVNPNEVPFDEKINLEIQLLKTKNKLSKERQAVFTEKKSPTSPTEKSQKSYESFVGLSEKIQFNCQTNIFVDVFYQLYKEYKIDGKPLLDLGFIDLAEFIITNFKDRHGNNLSLNTVKTILNPARPEKRPNDEKRIKLDIN